MTKDRFKQNGSVLCSASTCIGSLLHHKNIWDPKPRCRKGRRDRASYFMKILCSSAGSPDDLQGTSHTWSVGLSCTLHWDIKNCPPLQKGSKQHEQSHWLFLHWHSQLSTRSFSKLSKILLPLEEHNREWLCSETKEECKLTKQDL